MNNQDFKIGLCMSVVNELDKVKYSANTNATKRRVQELVRKFSSSVDNIFNSIPFLIVVPDKLNEVIQNTNLDKDDKDDVFIATVLNFKLLNPNEDVYIISNDLGVQLKCKVHNLQYKIPAEEYLIQEDDAVAKEIKKLTAELNRVKNLQPSLRLQFDSGEVYKKYDVNEPWKEYEDVIANEMEKVKKENPFLEPETDENPYGLTLLNLYKKTPERVAEYNKALEEYYSEYEVYLHKTKVSFYKENLTLILNIELSNTGNTPAENIDLYMHFPDGFTLSQKEDYYSKETEPSPPELSSYSLAPYDMSKMLTRLAFPVLPNIDLGGFSIKKTNSYDVRDHFKIIKHNHTGSVYPLYATFDTFEDVKSFEITYQITAANMVDMVEGKLNVIINKMADTEFDNG
ncbi:MAG: PIN domain-containing protein [Ginsengibacter sp.]